jgi:hypothetical protein
VGTALVLALLARTATPAAEGMGALGGTLASLPQGTSLVVQFTGVKPFLDKLDRSPLGRLRDHPELKSVLRQFEQELSDRMQEAELQLGFDPMDLLRCFEGEVLVAIGELSPMASQLGSALSLGQAPEMTPESIPVVLAADALSRGDEVAEYLEKLFTFAEKEGALRETLSVGSGKLTILQDKAEENDASSAGDSSPPMRLYFGRSGSRFYWGLNRAYVEACMGGGSGGSKLVNSPVFRTCQNLTGSGDVFFFLDVKQLTTAVNGALSATFFSFYWQKVESLLFGKSLNAAAGSYSVDDRGVKSTFFVHNGGASDGLLGIFRGTPFPPTPPGFVPKTAKIYSASVMDATKLGDTIRGVFEVAMSLQAPGADLDSLFEQNVGVPFKDLIGAFGDRLHYFGETLDAENPFASLNYLMELRDAGPLRRIVEKMTGDPAMSLQVEKYKGSDLMAIPLGPAGSVAVAVSDKMLIVAGGDALARQVVDGLRTDSVGGDAGTGGVRDAALKEQVASIAPAQVSMLTLSSDDYVETYFETISSSLGDSVPPDAAPVLSVLSALGSVLGSSVGYGQWNDSGLYGETVVLFRK